jgi:hypothetical protein
VYINVASSFYIMKSHRSTHIQREPTKICRWSKPCDGWLLRGFDWLARLAGGVSRSRHIGISSYPVTLSASFTLGSRLRVELLDIIFSRVTLSIIQTVQVCLTNWNSISVSDLRAVRSVHTVNHDTVGAELFVLTSSRHSPIYRYCFPFRTAPRAPRVTCWLIHCMYYRSVILGTLHLGAVDIIYQY